MGKFISGFVVGAFIGANLGLLIHSMMIAAREADKKSEELNYKDRRDWNEF